MNGSIAEQERVKYAEIWSKQDYSSRDWMQFADYIIATVPKYATILEVGCGDGRMIRYLTDEGYKVFGLDITTNQVTGVKENRLFTAPVWKTDLCNNAVDYVISTDVMEHIPPEMVDISIKELARVAKMGQIHRIATFPDHEYHGHKVHLSVHPIEWWREKFAEVCGNTYFEILER